MTILAALALAVRFAVAPGRRRPPTQAARLLKMFRAAGSHGLTAADVASAPPDGGSPILRFNSRVHDLRNGGHTIVAVGRRHRCQVFRLLEGVPARRAPATSTGTFARPQEPLWAARDTSAPPPLSPYHPDVA